MTSMQIMNTPYFQDMLPRVDLFFKKLAGFQYGRNANSSSVVVSFKNASSYITYKP